MINRFMLVFGFEFKFNIRPKNRNRTMKINLNTTYVVFPVDIAKKKGLETLSRKAHAGPQRLDYQWVK